MEITRLTELSLYHLVQDTLSRRREKEKPKSADFRVFNLKYISVQTNYPVVVFLNNVVMDESLYTVNYIEGSVKLNSPIKSTDKLEVSYTYCPINVYDDSNSPFGNDFKYPAVAIYEYDREDVARELGTNQKNIETSWIVEVWCTRGGERSDITDKLMEMFREHIPIVDYNIAFPFDETGAKNSTFNLEEQKIGYAYCDSINYRKGGSLDIGDNPKFFTEIIADLTITI